MMLTQAIVTKYLGPTNFRGSRIKATAAAGSITVHYPHALNPDKAHAFAASQLAEKFNWVGVWYAGGMPSGDGNCFVNAGDARPDKISDAAFVIVETRESVR